MSLIKTVPKSDATNVFDLLQDVKQVVMEETARLDMNVVATEARGKRRTACLYDPDMRKRKDVQVPVPSCGTVGCFAGWCQMLAGAKASRVAHNWTNGAKSLLGLDLKYTFVGNVSDAMDAEAGFDTATPVYDYFNWGAGDGIYGLKPGTRAYARAVCKRIDRFIADNGGKDVLLLKPLNKETL